MVPKNKSNNGGALRHTVWKNRLTLGLLVALWTIVHLGLGTVVSHPLEILDHDTSGEDRNVLT